MEKVQWISIDKKQNGLKYSKNDKSSTLPRPAQIISPRAYSQIRSEKSRSIRKYAPRLLRARPPQSEGKGMLQTHYIEGPALLSQHSRDAKYTIGKIILPLDQGRWNTVKMEVVPQFWATLFQQVSISTPWKFNNSHINIIGYRIFTSQPKSTLL